MHVSVGRDGSFCSRWCSGSLVGRNLLVTRRISQAALPVTIGWMKREAILRRLLKRRGLGRRLRAVSSQPGAVATRRNDHAEALVQLRQGDLAVSGVVAQEPAPAVVSVPVIALCNLGQMEEARGRRLLSVHKAEQGDTDRLKYWTTELYLRFARGKPPPPSGCGNRRTGR